MVGSRVDYHGNLISWSSQERGWLKTESDMRLTAEEKKKTMVSWLNENASQATINGSRNGRRNQLWCLRKIDPPQNKRVAVELEFSRCKMQTGSTVRPKRRASIEVFSCLARLRHRKKRTKGIWGWWTLYCLLMIGIESLRGFQTAEAVMDPNIEVWRAKYSFDRYRSRLKRVRCDFIRIKSTTMFRRELIRWISPLGAKREMS